MTLDPDVASDLKRRARRTGTPFRQLLNDALRAGLQAQDAPPSRRYQIEPVSLGGVVPGVDLDRALRLADALEDESLARKLELRK